jgi:hypothetical protein
MLVRVLREPVALSVSTPPLVGQLLSICRAQLGRPTSVRDVAGVVVGKLLTRTDMTDALYTFTNWAQQCLDASDAASAFLIPGAWRHAVQVHRQVHRQVYRQVYSPVLCSSKVAASIWPDAQPLSAVRTLLQNPPTLGPAGGARLVGV